MADDTKPTQPITITRADLYNEVWTTPMQQLAARYGISGNGLAKICDRLKVPYPGRGYWARKTAGQKVDQTRLPDKPADVPSEVTIRPTPPAPPSLSPELAASLAAAREQVGGLAVPKRLALPHPIVARWTAERAEQRQRARQHSWYHGSRVADFMPLERRRHRILSVLWTVLEKHGFKAAVDERGKTRVEVDKEPAEFSLREKFRQVRRPLTEEEKRGGLNPKRPWKQETQATGLLEFSIETYLALAMPRIWIDQPELSLEMQLPEIVAVFLAAGPLVCTENLNPNVVVM